jgi:hypothetical protein
MKDYNKERYYHTLYVILGVDFEEESNEREEDSDYTEDEKNPNEIAGNTWKRKST